MRKKKGGGGRYRPSQVVTKGGIDLAKHHAPAFLVVSVATVVVMAHAQDAAENEAEKQAGEDGDGGCEDGEHRQRVGAALAGNVRDRHHQLGTTGGSGYGGWEGVSGDENNEIS